MVREEEGDRRRRTAFVITEEGKKHLAATWRNYLADATADNETILRAVTLALIKGDETEKNAGLGLLSDAAAFRRLHGRKLKAIAEQLRGEKLSSVTMHRWMRAECEADTVLGEAAALSTILDVVRSRIGSADAGSRPA